MLIRLPPSLQKVFGKVSTPSMWCLPSFAAMRTSPVGPIYGFRVYFARQERLAQLCLVVLLLLLELTLLIHLLHLGIDNDLVEVSGRNKLGIGFALD